jgi:signal transduction histidine kinase
VKPSTATRRDVAVNVAFVLLSMLAAVLTSLGSFERPNSLVTVDLAVVLLACVLLSWRRRWPLSVAVTTAVVAAIFPAATGAALLALFSLAVHRSLLPKALGGAVLVGALIVGARPAWGAPISEFFAQVGLAVVLAALMIGWGTTVRGRRQLIASLIELARSAESTERERAQRIRAEERSHLASEMHDVLAHRMSLVAIHAGALEFRDDASREETREAAGVIRAGVHQMLVDLRDVIEQVRDRPPVEGFGSSPSLTRVAVLFEESESAGSPVDAIVDIEGLDGLPGSVDRAAFRVVQEGLTNARKHGGAVPVSVVILGSAATGLEIAVRQPVGIAVGSGSPVPGAGAGLAGLTERVLLAGGTLDYGREDDCFVLTARFPLQKKE